MTQESNYTELQTAVGMRIIRLQEHSQHFKGRISWNPFSRSNITRENELKALEALEQRLYPSTPRDVRPRPNTYSGQELESLTPDFMADAKAIVSNITMLGDNLLAFNTGGKKILQELKEHFKDEITVGKLAEEASLEMKKVVTIGSPPLSTVTFNDSITLKMLEQAKSKLQEIEGELAQWLDEHSEHQGCGSVTKYKKKLDDVKNKIEDKIKAWNNHSQALGDENLHVTLTDCLDYFYTKALAHPDKYMAAEKNGDALVEIGYMLAREDLATNDDVQYWAQFKAAVFLLMQRGTEEKTITLGGSPVTLQELDQVIKAVGAHKKGETLPPNVLSRPGWAGVQLYQKVHPFDSSEHNSPPTQQSNP